MSDLLQFLQDRIADDIRLATAPSNGLHGRHLNDPVGTVDKDCPDCVTPYRRDRMLAEVEAKRRLLDLHPVSLEYGHCCVDPNSVHLGEEMYWGEPCDTLRLLSLAYSYHPDYNPDWAPPGVKL